MKPIVEVMYDVNQLLCPIQITGPEMPIPLKLAEAMQLRDELNSAIDAVTHHLYLIHSEYLHDRRAA